MGKIRRSVRVTPEEDEAINALGGLSAIVCKALRNISLEEEVHREAIRGLRQKLDQMQAEMNAHIESLEKLRVQREHVKKMPVEPETVPERGLIQFKNRRVAPKIVSPKEWELKFKVLYLMMYAEYGKLSAADEQAAIKHLGLKPPETVMEWLYKLTPEKIPMETLEKSRTAMPLGLKGLKRQGKISEHFYGLLMMWLSLPAKESVDRWIAGGMDGLAEVATSEGVPG